MMLSVFDSGKLEVALDAIAHALIGHSQARAAFLRIARTKIYAPDLQADLYAGHDKATQLGRELGIPLLDQSPSAGFSWDGRAVALQTETAVLLHEFSHWQIAPASRRNLPDFGLGAGPETGFTMVADAACCVDDGTKEREEDLASLLGIIWEVYLGGPALIAFCEQNWLELYDRPDTAKHFLSVFEDLATCGLVDANGLPQLSRTDVK